MFAILNFLTTILIGPCVDEMHHGKIFIFAIAFLGTLMLCLVFRVGLRVNLCPVT